MTKYTIAQNPTNWTTALEKIYAKQSEQLQRYHDQLRQRDQQLVAKAGNESLANTLGSLAQFSSTVSKAVQIGKASKAEKENKKQSEARLSWIKNFTVEDRPEAERLIKWKTDEANLKLDFAEFEAKVNASETLSPAAKSALIDSHGANILYYQHIIGQGKLDDAVATINNGFTDDTPLRKEWDQAQLKGNDSVKAFVERYLVKELGTINISDEQLVDKYLPQILKLANTKEVLNAIKISDRKLTEKNIERQTRIDNAGKSGDTNALAKEAQTQIQTLGHDQFLLNAFQASQTGEFTNTELEQMLEGYIKHPGGDIIVTKENQKKYPGFEIGAKIGKGKLLFGSEEHLPQLLNLQKGINKYNKIQVNNFEASETLAATNDIAYIIKGDDTVENLQKKKDDRLLRLERTIGKDSQVYKDLESIDPTLQDADSYAATRQQYRGYYNNTDIGKLLQNKENFKLIPNKRVSDELAGKVLEAEIYLRELKLPTTWADWETRGKKKIKTSDGQKNNFKKGETLSPKQLEIAQEVAQKELQLHLLMKGQFKDPNKEKDEAEKQFDEWIVKEGLNVKDIKGNEKLVGRLSPDINGNYTRAEEIGDARAENATLPQHSYYQTLWSNRRKTAMAQHKGNIKNMLSDPESLIDKEDSLGSFIENNATGEFQLYYSPELIQKSLEIGAQPGDVLKESIKALTKDSRYTDFVNRHDLKNKLKLLENAPDLKLKELIDTLGDKNLTWQYNYAGILRFSESQIKRLIKLEEDLNKNETKSET